MQRIVEKPAKKKKGRRLVTGYLFYITFMQNEFGREEEI